MLNKMRKILVYDRPCSSESCLFENKVWKKCQTKHMHECELHCEVNSHLEIF